MLSGETNAVKAARRCWRWAEVAGSEACEYGATVFFGEQAFVSAKRHGRSARRRCRWRVVDPTGAAIRLRADSTVSGIAAGADAGGVSQAMFYGGVMARSRWSALARSGCRRDARRD